ncbi:PAS domain-containing hybrid sensor histidine kinase/response regulator [Azohydromonas caseinilytica]|uniref:PAS domain-containing hybrid sensor histidine kinase/response regulator n=1 Tax=Azohydromonas caseinilytica TaxID=2728836 RepID=UPI002872BE50|nr:PAS domain S-box protein [Azohydromonas caseinilytica]
MTLPPTTPPDDRFRLLVESVQDYAIFMLDTSGRVQSWNLGAQRLKGYEAAEIIGRSFEVFYPREVVERGWPREELERAAALGRFEDEGWRVRKDGSTFWASVVITALRDEQGRLTGFGKVTRDLTERKRQEETLRRSEEQFRLLMQSVKDYAIFMLDPEGRVLTWNAGARAIKGYAADEVIGRHCSMFFTVQDIEADVPRRELESALRSGHAEAEGWRVRKDGTLFWANVVITPVHDDAGVLHGFAKVTRDLTEQRRMQELEHSSRRMHEFLAMLAHELRNPLAPIRNASEIMQRMPELPAPLVRVRQIIDRQLRHLTRLIDDLLDVARIVNGKIVLRPELLDYRDVVGASADAVRPVVASRSQRLEVDLPAAALTMRADATRIAQSLQNLLGNASRYTPEGGEIRVAVRVEGLACLTTVTDTGCGIAPEALERIFGLFEQADTPQQHAEGGLGIGLSLARKLVELHGGTLYASSQGPGQGSIFTMLLPLEPRDALQPPPRQRPEGASPTASCRVLVVDDNRDSADTMVSLLQLLGHEAHAVYGARDATGAARRFQPQVVLLDLNMPDGDGFSVLQRLRETGHGTVFVAAMTGYGQEADRRRTAQAGFQAHLTKPVSIDELQRLLRTAVTA